MRDGVVCGMCHRYVYLGGTVTKDCSSCVKLYRQLGKEWAESQKEKFRYVYTGPGGIDPQTAEEAEALEDEDAMRDLRQGADGRRNDIPGQ
jgi:hypothetical protein